MTWIRLPGGDAGQAGQVEACEECVGKTQKGDPRRQQTPARVTFKIESIEFLQLGTFRKS